MPALHTSPPSDHWSLETNNTRFHKVLRSQSDNTLNGSEDLTAALTQLCANVKFTHNARRDLLSFYKTLHLVPHPQLVPFHPDQEDPSTNSADGPIAYDLAEIDSITVKNWQLDDGTLHGLGYILPKCPSIHSLTLFNVQLSSNQVETLFQWIVNTHITHFALDWNAPVQPSNETSNLTPAPELYGILLGPTSPITNLSLRSSGLMTVHAHEIATALRSNTKLHTLNLFQNQEIGDEGVMAIAYALPFNKTLKSLSLANTGIKGHTAKLLVEVLTTYAAPSALLREVQEAELRVLAEVDAAKKAKKKIDRSAIIAGLGLPVLEVIDGVQYAPGNATLEDLVLSGNPAIEEDDVVAMNNVLEQYHAKLVTHLRRIKLQRIPALKTLAHQSAHQLSTTIVSTTTQSTMTSSRSQTIKLSEFLHF